MSNPLPDEKELYEKIAKEKLSIPQPILRLLDHHLGNDLYAITLIAGSRVTGEEKEPIPIEEGQKIIGHCMEIKKLLEKIKQVTKPK